MALSHSWFSEEKLLTMGFKRCPPIIRKFEMHSHEIVEQWEYKTIYFVRQNSPSGIQFGVMDKNYPEFTLLIDEPDGLYNILRAIDKGKSIGDLFMESQQRRKIVWERMEGPVEKRPFIEDYRDIEIGRSHFRFSSDLEKKLNLSYLQHAQAAYDYTLRDIQLFEDSFDFVHTGHSVHSAIGLWHMSLESYITTLLKLCCLKKNEDFHKKYKNLDVHKRLSSLLDLLELDKTKFHNSKIFAKIYEFSRFRNELMHDRHFGKALKFDYCQFSGIPAFACQVDAMQCMLITLEVASLLRFAIAGLDTMPPVVVQDGQRVSWEKLDITYNEILRPFFEYALEKHAMQTRLNLKYNDETGDVSPVFSAGEIECMVVVDQEAKHEIILNDSKTRRLPQLIQQYFQTRNQPENTLRLARTMLNK